MVMSEVNVHFIPPTYIMFYNSESQGEHWRRKSSDAALSSGKHLETSQLLSCGHRPGEPGHPNPNPNPSLRPYSRATNAADV